MRPKIAISINSAWNFVNFRAGLIRTLVAHGYEVVAISPPDQYVAEIEQLGCRFVPIEMHGRGTSISADIRLFLDYLRILRRERPAVFLGFTVKPNIFGAMAAQRLGIPTIVNIAGLGMVFTARSLVRLVVERLYRLSLSQASTIFFQNHDDRIEFESRKLVSPGRSIVLPGSGVDLQRFQVPSSPQQGLSVTFLLSARLLWQKGVAEFVSAARHVRNRHPESRFWLMGFVSDGPDAVDRPTLEKWVAEGDVEYLGEARDVRPHISAADVVVLPTFYREGVPRSLIEGAAMGKPIIATDVAGCRDIVTDGRTGVLIPPRDDMALANAMIAMIDMGPGARQAIGMAGRRKVEREFDEAVIGKAYLTALHNAANFSGVGERSHDIVGGTLR